MRHAQDGAAAAMSAASRVLVARGRNEPQEQEDPDVAWGQRARDGVWVPTRDGQRVHIGLGAVGGDAVAQVLRPTLRAFVGVDVDTDLLAQTTAGGVRLLTVIHGPDAPTEFRFSLSLPDGLALEAMPSGGYDIVHLRYGATVGRLYNPWASDAMFRPVKADYALEGQSLTMRVQHEGSFYPVVADPHYAR
ncbi:hypothetical protein [Actinomadura rayongensis]|uniref:Uncharacterized protein n=1 Tax=Actinomadura rayongensis TaxID=1429076 RepID=A0A6I4WFH7_9ACTN|nr:hypothetical protein [Actinomadura rayongensis]MXQ67065.1 hypothetical protein [Actinomadura rayongensis]